MNIRVPHGTVLITDLGGVGTSDLNDRWDPNTFSYRITEPKPGFREAIVGWRSVHGDKSTGIVSRACGEDRQAANWAWINHYALPIIMGIEPGKEVERIIIHGGERADKKDKVRQLCGGRPSVMVDDRWEVLVELDPEVILVAFGATDWVASYAERLHGRRWVHVTSWQEFAEVFNIPLLEIS